VRVADLLQSRQPQWRELEQLCAKIHGRKRVRMPPATLTRFAALYRAACADLALADAYQLPPGTIHYLHQLVAQAHNQFYRSRTFRVRAWFHELFVVLPRQLLADRCLWLAFVIFWGVFALSVVLGYKNPEYAEQVAGREALVGIEELYSHPTEGRDADASGLMAGFYVWNNPTIGLRCFAFGLVFGIGGLFAIVENAQFFGVICAHMATSPHSENFFHFVTAHGPMELTAIVLAAAAGMKLGFSIIDTGGRTRIDSLRRAARQRVPMIAVSVLMFCIAAGIEAFLSPSSAPYWIKAGTAILSTALIVTYFIVLGIPRKGIRRQSP
jgi:uncharacterized membrane protein SpoIIM required for sporulation